jgi:hypothetical protein
VFPIKPGSPDFVSASKDDSRFLSYSKSVSRDYSKSYYSYYSKGDSKYAYSLDYSKHAYSQDYSKYSYSKGYYSYSKGESKGDSKGLYSYRRRRNHRQRRVRRIDQPAD